MRCIEQALTTFAAHLRVNSKVRLTVDQAGAWEITAEPLAQGTAPEPVRLGLAAAPIDSGDIWLYHKTTQRTVYAAARAARPDCDDVLLWNERGEMTETTTANVVLALDGELVTPPVDCGLLAGVLRASILRGDTPTPGDKRVRERLLTLADLDRCQAIYLINSVRRWRHARLVN